MKLTGDGDIVVARRRARQIALLLGFDAQDQTRISTAVSEIVRNAVVHAGGGKLDFLVADKVRPYLFIISLTDKGPGIENIDRALSGKDKHTGMSGASRLMDKFEAKNLTEGGCTVKLEKVLKSRLRPFSPEELNDVANALTRIVSANPIDEVHQQNQELLAAMDLLSQKQAQLDLANNALAENNNSLLVLNEKILALNDSLEVKVQSRTSQLQETMSKLELARDEAVLANKLKSQFVANISHEIRTPMNGILSSTELVLDGGNLDAENEELITMAHESARSLMTIINDLLDFAKLEAGKPVVKNTDFCITALIDSAIQSVSGAANKKHLPLLKDIDESLRDNVVTADELLMQRVILNLLHNAVKFTWAGEVKVSASIVKQDGNNVVVRCMISDTGIGIPESDRKRLFQPFVQGDGTNTRNYGGTGLGLSISMGYVEVMGGTMGYESVEHAGSKFWFDVPMVVVTT